MNSLTRQELDLLIEALGHWERLQCSRPNSLAAAIRAAMPPCSDPDCESCREAKAQEAAEARHFAEASKLASERSILLRAKLIGLRDSQAADKLFAEAKGNA